MGFAEAAERTVLDGNQWLALLFNPDGSPIGSSTDNSRIVLTSTDEKSLEQFKESFENHLLILRGQVVKDSRR